MPLLQSEIDSVIAKLQRKFSPADYFRSCGHEPYEWQEALLNSSSSRGLVVTARQCGKTTSTGGKIAHTARFPPPYDRRALQVVVDPSQDQAKDMMQAIEDVLLGDESIVMDVDAVFEKELRGAGRIRALPGTERAVRGPRGPRRLIFDEAARVPDATYHAAVPMLTTPEGEPERELWMLSTPFGQSGFFWEIWNEGDPDRWHKILVQSRWDVTDDGYLVEGMPEDELRDYWQQAGVEAYYSPRHTREFCQEQLELHGVLWYRQEFRCEFLEDNSSMFRREAIMAAESEDVSPLFLMEDPDVPIAERYQVVPLEVE